MLQLHLRLQCQHTQCVQTQLRRQLCSQSKKETLFSRAAHPAPSASLKANKYIKEGNTQTVNSSYAKVRSAMLALFVIFQMWHKFSQPAESDYPKPGYRIWPPSYHVLTFINHREEQHEFLQCALGSVFGQGSYKQEERKR